MPWLLVIEIGLKLAGYLFGSWSNENEREKWINDKAKALRRFRLVRQKFILELEKKQKASIDEQRKKLQESKTQNNEG